MSGESSDTGAAPAPARVSAAAPEGLAAIALDGLADPIYLFDAGGLCIYANRAASRALDYSPAALRGLPLAALVPGMANDATASAVSAPDSPAPASTVFFRARDGQLLEQVASVSRCDLDGVAYTCLSVRAVEPDAERAPVRYLRDAIEELSEAVTLRGPDDRLVFANRAARELNRDVAEFLVPGTPYVNQLHALAARGLVPEAVGREAEWVAERLHRHSEPQGWFELSRQDGRSMVVLEQRVPDGGTITIAADNSARKRAEVALRESEARLRQIIDLVPHNIFVKDVHGRFVLVNRAQAEAYGTSASVLEGDMHQDRHSVESEIRWFLRDDQMVIASGQPMFVPEERFVNASGERRYLEVTKIPFTMPEAGGVAVLGVAIDITERKRHEEELARHRDHLQDLVDERTRELDDAQQDLLRAERLAALGQLTATVSHELRNPLATIRTSLFVLRDRLKGAAAEELKRPLARAERGIQRCVHIIEELLVFSQNREPVLASVYVDAWLAETVADHVFDEAIVLRTAFAAGCTLEIDPHRLQQAVNNLISNAGQAILEAGGPGELSIMSRIAGGRLEVVVTDSGPGIPHEVRERIFEPLFSTKSFGIGLGLPLVQRVAEQHGGGVEVRSEPGAGAVVTLWLPLARAPADGAADTVS